MAHGNAERLLAPGHIDFAALDAALRSGGEGENGERLALGNDLLGPKRFGRIFPDLPPFRPPDDGLTQLGLQMQETPPGPSSTIPAGFTYVGQFVDHDLTLDPTTGFPFINDVSLLEDARNPTFDIDSVYGLGPELQPELYDPAFSEGRARFKIGSTSPLPSAPGRQLPNLPTSLPNDLPRAADGTAVIGDSRNDENLVVAQTHLAFLKFHNRVMDTLRDDDSAFDQARKLVTWHYQWILLNDFLPRILDPATLADVRDHGPRFFKFDKPPFRGRPFMPIEFSAAAYRLGHSMVRPVYNYNRAFNGVVPTAFVPASLQLLFTFTGRGGLGASSPQDARSGIPSNWIIDWRRFHEVEPEPKRSQHLNLAQLLDTKITAPLFQLPVPGVVPALPNQLPVRNLLRGSRLGLPRGQDVATAMGLTPLTPGEVAGGTDGDTLRQFGFDTETPLWYYILKEAELHGHGSHLGEVGSRIVAEVFVGLIQANRKSFLSQPRWKPTLPAAVPGTFTFADLLLFVNDINPIGESAGDL